MAASGTKIGGIYVEVDGDIMPLEESLRKIAVVAKKSADEIGTALGGALSSKQVEAGLNALAKNLQTLRGYASSAGKDISGLAIDLDALQKITGVTADQWRVLQDRMLKTSAQVNAANAFKALQRQTGLSASELETLGVKAATMPAHLQRVTSSAHATGLSFSDLTRYAAMFGVTISAISFVNFITSTQEAHREMISISRAFESLMGGVAGAATEMAALRQVSDALGKNFYDVAPAYKGLLSAAQQAGLAAADSREMFQAVLEASTALGLSGEHTSGILLAWQQMISKGTVSMEELRRQMGEHLPGAFNMAARAMGMTTEEFNKAVESGKVLALDLLPKLSQVLREEYSEKAKQFANDSIATWERFKQATKDLTVAVGDSLAPAFNAALKTVTEWINANRDNLGPMLSAVGDGMKIAAAGATAFGVAMAVVKWESIAAGIAGAAGAMRAFTLAMVTNPIFALAAVATALAAAMILTKDAAEKAAESAAKLAEETKKASDEHVAQEKKLQSAEKAMQAYDRAMAAAGGDTRKQTEALNLLKGAFPDLVANVKIGSESQDNLRASLDRVVVAMRETKRVAQEKYWDSISAEIANMGTSFDLLIAKINEANARISGLRAKGGLSNWFVSFEEGDLNKQFSAMAAWLNTLPGMFEKLATAQANAAGDPAQYEAINREMQTMYERAVQAANAIPPDNPSSKGLAQILATLKEIMEAGAGGKGWVGAFASEKDANAFAAALEKESKAAREHYAEINTATLEAQKIRISAWADGSAKIEALRKVEAQIAEAKQIEKLAAGQISIAQYNTAVEAAGIISRAHIEADNIKHNLKVAEARKKLADEVALIGLSEIDRERAKLDAEYAQHLKATGDKELVDRLYAEGRAKIDAKEAEQKAAAMQKINDILRDTDARALEGKAEALAKVEAKYAKHEETIVGLAKKAGLDQAAIAEILAKLKINKGAEVEQEAQKQAEKAFAREAWLGEQIAQLTGDYTLKKIAELKKFEKELDAHNVRGEQRETLLAAKRVDINQSALQKMLKQWQDTDKLMEDSTRNMLQAVQSSFADVIGRGLKGEFDSLKDAWDAVMDALLNAFINMVAQLASIWAVSNIGSLLSKGNFSGGLSLSGLFGGGGTSAVGLLGTGAGLINAGSTVAGWLGLGQAAGTIAAPSAVLAAGGISATAADMAAGYAGSLYAFNEGVGAASMSGTGILGSVKAGLSSLYNSASNAVAGWFGATETAVSAELIGESGAMASGAAAAASEAAAGWTTSYAAAMEAEFAAMGGGGGAAAGSSLSSMLAAAAPALIAVAGTELLASAMGGTGPIGAITGLITGSAFEGGHTQASALDYITKDLELIQRQVALINQEIAAGADYNFVESRFGLIAPAVAEMYRLAETAGLTDTQIQQMIGSIDQSALSFASTATVISEIMIPGLSAMTETMNTTFVDAGGLNQMILDLAGSMGFTGEQARNVAAGSADLIQQFVWGQISAEVFADELQNHLMLAMQDAAGAGLDLASAIDSIPREVEIAIGYSYPEGGPRLSDPSSMPDLPSYDVGGWIRDTGPAMVHSGEYVLTRSDISAINSGALHIGRNENGGASLTIGNLTVVAQGLDISDPAQNRQAAAMLARNLRDEFARIDSRSYGRAN